MPVISKQCYIPGDVVFEIKSRIHCLHYDYKGKHCDNCLKLSNQLKRCAKCHLMFYCDQSCQMNDWNNGHKKECRVMFGQTFAALYHKKAIDVVDHLILRLCLYSKSNPHFIEEQHQTYDRTDLRIKDMDIDVDKVAKDRKNTVKLNLLRTLFELLEIDSDIQEMVFWYAFLELRMTSGSVYYTDNPNDIMNNDSDKPIACGITIGINDFQHSCFPNTAMISNGLTFEVRAIKDIAIGEEITRSRISINQNKKKRKKQLMDNFGYDCECHKCRLNLDKDIDYNKYDEMHDKHVNLWETISDSRIARLVHRNYEMDTQFMVQLQLIFGEYHPYITSTIVNNFILFSQYSQKATKPLLKYWYKLIKDHIRVTHGLSHPFFAMFDKLYHK
ncbi:histone-lysine N-methyltransferase SMYD3-like [Oppia nitens]|uniref:histone-lysine N-methyltransferase SMYD3-like n=1 Tax=Oppia nitens TaxID=1686743 RepID=UPI0023DC4768|nr:histone-lysine N-methyltransferase SMYD3-like [Oppia nitens]